MKDLYKPSHLFEFLNEINAKAKKSLSQNFLIDQNIIDKILSSASVGENDLILEIGPGPGVLTQALLDAKAHVIAIEKDTLFAKHLQRFQTPDNRLHVIETDFLKYPLGELLKNSSKKIKVVANLPYHITTPIIAKLFEFKERIESITIMVQKEVALRFIAEKNTPDYSSISVFIQYHSIPQISFTVKPTSFFPRPSVHSAVVHLDLRDQQRVGDESAFFSFVRTGFQQRRKMLRQSLKELYLPHLIEEKLTAMNLKNTARPEELSLEDFMTLFSSLPSLEKPLQS